MVIAIPAAIAAGLCFAVAGVLQQDVASRRPDEEELTGRLLVRLARRRRWLAGIGVALLSYAFQALALRFGPLALVQPLIVTEVVFALPLSVRLHGMRLGGREWLGAGGVTAGLALAIVSSNPHGGHPLASSPLGWLVTLSGVAVLGAAGTFVGMRVGGTLRASLLAFTAALILGMQSALLDATVALFSKGLVPALTSWQPYLMGVASIGGLLFIQSAFQAGPLASSMPVVDATEPTTAVVIGLALFGEVVSVGTWALLGTAFGILMAVAGIVTLDTSPVIHRLQRVERSERDEPT
ncbi:MAG: DMT family transporter [Streptosporangiales bacterium]